MRSPKTARAAPRGDEAGPQAETWNAARQGSLRELVIYDGRRCIGTLIVAGRREFRAIGADGTVVGVYDTQRAAVRATIAASAGG